MYKNLKSIVDEFSCSDVITVAVENTSFMCRFKIKDLYLIEFLLEYEVVECYNKKINGTNFVLVKKN